MPAIRTTWSAIAVAVTVLLAGVPAVATTAGTDVVHEDRVGADWHLADTRPGGTLAFRTTHGGTLGSGAAVLDTAASSTAKVQLLTDDWHGTRLADLAALTYATYQVTAPVGSPALPALNIRADMNADGTVDAYLVFEPYRDQGTAAVQPGVWQTWDALRGGAALWWCTTAVCPQRTATWAQLVSTFPEARILEDPTSLKPSTAPELHGSIGLNQGSSNAGVVGAADGLRIATATRDVTYDFERDLRPTVQPLLGEGLAGAPGAAVVMGPGTTTGDGPFTYALDQLPAWGSAGVDGTGTVTFTPPAGASGRVTFSYRATDTGHGFTGEPASVTVTIRPAVTGRPQVDTVFGRQQEVDLSEGVVGSPGAGGALVHTVTQPTGGAGTVVLDGSRAVFTPAEGFTGSSEFTYRVTGRDDVSSSVHTVPVTVAPAPGATPVVQTVATSRGEPVTFTVAAPSGTAPFSYRLSDGTAPGIAAVSIEPTTGDVALTPEPGFSGRLSMTYVVTDASGASARGSVAVIVRPVTGAAPTAATTDGRTTFALPQPVGAGPFVYRLVATPPTAHGTVTIEATTGQVTAAPGPGYAGTLAFAYAVTDGAGLTSDPTTVEVRAQAPAGVGRTALATTGWAAGPLVASAGGLVLAGAALSAIRRWW